MSMLKKPLRLKSARLFTQTLRGRQFYVNGFFAVYILKRQASKPPALPQFGLIISKKTEKLAVNRNRAKRQFREILRTHVIPQYGSELKQIQTVVIIIRPRALNTSFSLLKDHLDQCFKNMAVKEIQ